MGRLLMEHKDALVALETREIGKTLKESGGEIQEAIDTCLFFQSEGRRLYGQTVNSELPDKELFTYRRPLGVCGIINACNFPSAVPFWKMIPAIMCGNTCVWKSPQDAPLLSFALARIMHEAGPTRRCHQPRSRQGKRRRPVPHRRRRRRPGQQNLLHGLNRVWAR